MAIKCIFYDFDGVMTDNKVILSETGEELVTVNRSDGLAISYFKKLNVKQYIISTEKNEVVSKRAKKLGIEVYQGIDNKLSKIKSIMKENSVILLTTEAIDSISHIHNRMPLLSNEPIFKNWNLYPVSIDINVYEVSRKVSYTSNNSPELIKPLS